MSFLYGVTTPIGQAIGLAVHTLYDPASQFGLLMVGIVNAISAGLLLYAGLVQLLAEDFLSDASYVELQGRKRLEACAAVVAGSMLMAFVGACKFDDISFISCRRANDSKLLSLKYRHMCDWIDTSVKFNCIRCLSQPC